MDEKETSTRFPTVDIGLQGPYYLFSLSLFLYPDGIQYRSSSNKLSSRRGKEMMMMLGEWQRKKKKRVHHCIAMQLLEITYCMYK
jgi:hypothetical protein